MIKGSFRGASPLSLDRFPLSYEGEGDTGGEASKESDGSTWLISGKIAVKESRKE